MTEEFVEAVEATMSESDAPDVSDEAAADTPFDSNELVVTDEMLDNIADTAIAALQDILQYFNVGDVTIDEYEGDE